MCVSLEVLLDMKRLGELGWRCLSLLSSPLRSKKKGTVHAAQSVNQTGTTE